MRRVNVIWSLGRGVTGPGGNFGRLLGGAWAAAGWVELREHGSSSIVIWWF